MTHSAKSATAQLYLNLLLGGSTSGMRGRPRLRFLERFRSAICRLLDDPLVNYRLGQFKIVLPLSHNLPLTLKLHPDYSWNIVRIARHVKAKYHDLTFIDIGANIGDTVTQLRAEEGIPVLCIEGDERFFEMLRMNVARFYPEVEVERAFLGASEGVVRGRVVSERGTAYIVEDGASSTTIQLKTLSEVLKSHPVYSQSKMIKVDTDGLDCRLLKGELELLSRLKPVIFWEYDPNLFAKFHDDGFGIFEALRSIDYTTVIIYENTGEYLLTTSLESKELLEDIHGFYSGRASLRYADICALHREDSDLAQAIRQSELKFFQARRS